MKIGDLAKASGLSAHTLRYYEKSGLLKPKLRSDSNYRLYSEEDLTSALFIRRCKASGFSLDETKILLQIKDDKATHVCAEAKSLTQEKIASLNQQIESLQNMVQTLQELEQYCCVGQESAEFCSIISKLEGKPQSSTHPHSHSESKS